MGLLSSHFELLNSIASITTKITHFSPLNCLERYYEEIPQPAAEGQPTTFIFGNDKELLGPIHRLVEQLHNMVYLCRLHFFHNSFSYLRLVSFSFNLKHIRCRFTGTFTLYFGFKSCRPHLPVHEQIAIWNYPILYRLNFSFLMEYLWKYCFYYNGNTAYRLTHWVDWLNIRNQLLSISNQVSEETLHIYLERFIFIPSSPSFFGLWTGSPYIFLKPNPDCFVLLVLYPTISKSRCKIGLVFP